MPRPDDSKNEKSKNGQFSRQENHKPEETRAGTIGVPRWFRPLVFPSIALAIISFLLISWLIWLFIA